MPKSPPPVSHTSDSLGYAIITYVFSENREKYLGWAEASSGVGLMIGPVLGGVFYGGGIFPDST